MSGGSSSGGGSTGKKKERHQAKTAATPSAAAAPVEAEEEELPEPDAKKQQSWGATSLKSALPEAGGETSEAASSAPSKAQET